MAAVARALGESRLVTLAGPGGIGKSTVALAIAAELRGNFGEGARFVDLVPVLDPSLVPSALASVLDISLSADGSLGNVIQALKSKRILIVLDNCEHLAAASALLVETLLRSAPGVSVLATSREPLRAQGERVIRLQALTFPPAPAALTAETALGYSAIELFVERAMAAVSGFELTDADAPAVADLCRRLDGIPLAIELAAARIDAFGVKELAARLDDRIRLMMKGRRTALPRHRTLRGALDWSYETLSPRQQLVLCRLGVFPGGFDANAALAVVADELIPAAELYEELTELVSKSLVTSDVAGPRVRYRLLATTRAYALEKLAEREGLSRTQRRHAEYVAVRLKQIVETAAPHPPQSFSTRPPEDRAGTLDDMRAALSWAHGPSGDPMLAIELTIAAVPFAALFSLHTEFHGHVARALALAAELQPGTPLHAHLLLALGALRLHTQGSLQGLALKAHQLWEAIGEHNAPDLASRFEMLEGRWAEAFGGGDYPAAVEVASGVVTTARTSSPSLDHERNGERLLGIALHFSGDHTAAIECLRRVYDHFETLGTWRIYNSSQIDTRVSAGISRGRALWLLGESKAALALSDEVLQRATRVEHAATLCYTLAFLTCPLAVWRGDWSEAETYASWLATAASRHGLKLWETWARCYESLFDASKADTEWNEMQAEMRATLRDDLASDRLVARVESGHAGWCAPELLRAQGERLLRQGTSGEAAPRLFERALAMARNQRARFWELRAARSLAHYWHSRGEHARARELLAPLLDEPDQVPTLDARRARALLLELG